MGFWTRVLWVSFCLVYTTLPGQMQVHPGLPGEATKFPLRRSGLPARDTYRWCTVYGVGRYCGTAPGTSVIPTRRPDPDPDKAEARPHPHTPPTPQHHDTTTILVYRGPPPPRGQHPPSSSAPCKCNRPPSRCRTARAPQQHGLHTMAASPLVLPPANPLQPSLKTLASPLRRQSSAVPSSANGTPRSSRPAGHPAQPPQQPAQPPTMDLAEQMNMEERRKYVKGACPTRPATCHPPPPGRAHS